MTDTHYCHGCGTTEGEITAVAVILDSDPDSVVDWALCRRCWAMPSCWTSWRPAGEFARQKHEAYLEAQRTGQEAPPTSSLQKPRTETVRKKRRWTADERRTRREHDEAARLSDRRRPD